MNSEHFLIRTRVLAVCAMVLIFSNMAHAESEMSEDLAEAACSYRLIIAEAANRYQIDPSFIMAIIMAESGFDPKAVSKRGAMGLMQLMPGTAESLGVEDGFDAEKNIDAGVRYFKQLLDRFDGETKLALAAYNSGTRKVIKYNGIPPFETTKAYIRNVFAYYRIFKNQNPEETWEICTISLAGQATVSR